MNRVTRNILIASGIYVATMGINFFYQKKQAVTRARALSGLLGIANLGAGCQRSFVSESICKLPEVVANVDVVDCEDCPHYTEWDLDAASLPFSTGQFDVVLASHVLEHLNHWQAALTEWSRIAEHVILALPNPFSLGQLNSQHKQFFTYADFTYIRQTWPKTEIFA